MGRGQNLQDLKMTDYEKQSLENEGPLKWRAKSQACNLQDLENGGLQMMQTS